MSIRMGSCTSPTPTRGSTSCNSRAPDATAPNPDCPRRARGRGGDCAVGFSPERREARDRRRDHRGRRAIGQHVARRRDPGGRGAQ
jgi:hypothetical protein